MNTYAVSTNCVEMVIDTGNGTLAVYAPDNPNANCHGYVLQHRIVMERYLCRYLTKNEKIVHINGNKKDNGLVNLKLSSLKEIFNTKQHKEMQSNNMKGSKNHRWIGGIKITKGYISELVYNHPYASTNSRVYQHRLVMEKYLGRYLTPVEEIHHINGIKTDNRIENLQLVGNHIEHLSNFHKKR